MRGVFALLFLAALAAQISPAVAQASRERPGQIGPLNATSACIGAPSTATCAVETLLACLARNDESLCSRVGAVLSQRGEPQQVEYAIEHVSVIRPEDVGPDMQDLDWYKPGYTLAEVARRSCAADAASCEDESWQDLQVYLKRADGGAWQIVAWRGDEDETAPDAPEITR